MSYIIISKGIRIGFFSCEEELINQTNCQEAFTKYIDNGFIKRV